MIVQMISDLVTGIPASAVGQAHALSAMVPMDGVIPNPQIKSPGGNVESSVTSLVGIIKWGVVVIIVATGFVGVGLVAAGKFLSHERSARAGVIVILCAVIAAALFGGIYGLITMFIS